MDLRKFQLGCREIVLQWVPAVFEPNLTTRMLADLVPIPQDSRVLDLGCGVGPIAILAALSGATDVVGVDIMPEACALAQRNAELNGVEDRVRFIQGNLYESLNGERFDLIIDDVSGMAEGVSRISPWYPETIPTGGPDGTGPTIAMLEQAQHHLTERGVLYFPVLSLANRQRILEKARNLFGDCLESVATKWVPFCDEFKVHMHEMEQMKAKGLIDYVTKRSRNLWSLEIYRVRVSS